MRYTERATGAVVEAAQWDGRPEALPSWGVALPVDRDGMRLTLPNGRHAHPGDYLVWLGDGIDVARRSAFEADYSPAP